MFRLDILQNQWLILALLGGGAMVLGMVLAYMAFWRRPEDDAAGPKRRGRGLAPWFLIVTYALTAAFVIAYTLRMAARPPNW